MQEALAPRPITRHAPRQPGEEARSADWPAVEREHLRKEPGCRACGSTRDLNVHHIVPFHVRPTLELAPGNLVTLCRAHHLVFGHLMNWAGWNANVIRDADRYRTELAARPE